MGNKKTTYLLLPLVIALWGFIGYKVYVSLVTEPVYRAPLPKVVDWEEKKSAPEDYHLRLNYKDPFLSHLPVVKNKAEMQQNEPKVVRAKFRQPEQNQLPEKSVNWKAFAFMGILENARTGALTALVTYKDRQMLLKVGQKVDGFMVEKIFPDSLKLRFEQQTQVITILSD